MLQKFFIFALATYFFTSSAYSRTTEPQSVSQSAATAAAIGLKFDPSWRDPTLELVRYKGGYPFIAFLAANISSDDFIELGYFKKNAKDSIHPVFEFGRSLEVQFSPTGEKILLVWGASAGYVNSFVFPVTLFDIRYDKALEIDELQSKYPSQAVDFEEIIKKQLPLMQHCRHPAFSGEKWIDDAHIQTDVDGSYCGVEDDHGYGHWTGVMNLTTRELENIKVIEVGKTKELSPGTWGKE